ncbi:MAG: hypothetical protein WD627_08505 [Actinomycetota bacterium]
MNTRRAAARWGAGLVSTLLLSLVPAYFAAGVALAATGGKAPAWVPVAFFATLLLAATLHLRPTRPHDALQHLNVERESKRGVAPALMLAAIPIAFLITYPHIARIGTLIVGNTGDSGLNIYLLEWQMHAAINDLDSYFDPTIFAPEKFTLFWGPALIPLVPAYALAKLLTGNPIASFNLLMVAASAGTLFATYLFARRAGFGRLSSGVGAVLFATTAQRIAHLGHLDSFQTLWIPVFALLLLRVWEKNLARHGVLLGVALGLSLLSAPYYFLAGIGVVGLMFAIHLPAWKSMPWKGIAAAAASTLAIGGPVLLMSRLAGLSRSPEELVPISWADFYHPGAYVPAMRWLAAAAGEAGGGETLEILLFGSMVLTLLGTVGAWSWLRSRRKGLCPLPAAHPKALSPLLVALSVSGLVMAAGPYLRVGGARIPLPMLLLMKLPGFESARVTGRFMTSALLALTIVSLVGLESLTSRVGRKVGSLLIAMLSALALLTTQASYPAAALDVSGRPADVNRELATRPMGLVVELPWSGCPGYGCLYTEPPRMIWSRFDWFPRLGGYSGHIPDYWIEAQESLRGFPDELSLDFLRRFGARYVILRVSAGEEGTHFTEDEAAAAASTARLSPGIAHVERFGNDYLLTLR